MKLLPSKTKRAYNKSFVETTIPWVAIIGNPNSGKTAVFNHLTGSTHKIGNYPGVTVEKKSGWLKGHRISIHDLPGSYSLNSKSLDEKVVEDTVQSWRIPAQRPRAVIVVLDASNLSRNLYLTLQILEWGIPTIVVLNMMDEVRKRDIAIDVDLLRELLQAYAVIPASAKTGEGIKYIIEAVLAAPQPSQPETVEPKLITREEDDAALRDLVSLLENYHQYLVISPLVDSMRLVSEESYARHIVPFLSVEDTGKLSEKIRQARLQYKDKGVSCKALESIARYAYIDSFLADTFSEDKIEKKSFSERIDSILSHTIWGPVILVVILGFIFNSIFIWAEYPMEWIESGVAWMGEQAHALLPGGVFKSLIIDGVIAGVGNVIVFLPQIVLLIFFLSLLEDSGYLARMAFILDRLMSKIGLHGKAVLPMLSGFACAIPAIMASRTIENWRDRLVTIMLIPLMSCSARLPVYVLLISAFIPQQTYWGFIKLQGLMLMGMYFLGFFTALIISMLIKKFVPEKSVSNFILELPPYRMPMPRSVWWKVYDSAKLFLVNAGSIILAISVILWFLASYPKPDESLALTSKEKVAQSYAGQIGHFVEPVIEPLGFDWKIGVGLIASFAAREVLVSTFATLYNIEGDEENIVPLIKTMRRDLSPDGRPVFSMLVAISLLVYFVYAAQCMATFAIIKRETNSWRWPIVMVMYMTVLAYVAALIVYQGGTSIFGSV
jgi:ferrous iron transport protein B